MLWASIHILKKELFARKGFFPCSFGSWIASIPRQTGAAAKIERNRVKEEKRKDVRFFKQFCFDDSNKVGTQQMVLCQINGEEKE